MPASSSATSDGSASGSARKRSRTMTASWSMTTAGPSSGTGCASTPRDPATRSASVWTRARTDGIRESAWSSGSWCHRSTTRRSSSDTSCGVGEPTLRGVTSASVAQTREEPHELDVEPDDRDDEAVGEQPRVLLRGAHLDRTVDRVEVDGEGVRREADTEDRQADAERAAGAEAPAVDDAGHEQHDLQQREEAVADDREEEHPARLVVDLDEAGRVADVHGHEDAERGEDGHLHDAVVLGDRRDVLAEGPEEGALEHGVDHEQRHRDLLHEGDDEAEDQRAEHTAEPERQRHVGVGLGPEPRHEGHGDRDDEEREALDDNVVDRDATGVGRAGRRLRVHLVELLRRHRVLGRIARGRGLRAPLRRLLRTALGRAEPGVALLLDLLVEPVEDRVSTCHVSALLKALGATTREWA